MENNTDDSSNSEKNNEVSFLVEDEKTTCQNCELEHEIGFEFCPHCGQKTNDELTLGVLFYNTLANYFSFDARFFKSFIPLMFRPGILAKRFLEGKRLLYLHPAQMYLFISVVFFFLFTFISRTQVESANKMFQKKSDAISALDSLPITNPIDSVKIKEFTQKLKDSKVATGMSDEDIQALDSLVVASADANKELKKNLTFDFDQKKVDSLIALNASDAQVYKAMGMSDDAGNFKRKFYSQMLKFYKQRNAGTLLQAFYDTIPIAMFVLLPIFAFILKLLYYRRGRFSHHLVFSFYFFSFLFTVFSIVILINFIWDIPDWIDWLVAVSTFFYLVSSTRRFYGQGYFWSFFKSSIATFIFMPVLMIAAIIILGFAFISY